jgi:hypothetical protein
MGRDSRRRRCRSFRFLLRSHQASLLAAASSAGALADNTPAEMSSRYRRVGGVRVVVRDGVGVRVVLGGDLFPILACGESLHVGLASDQRPYGKCSWSGESAHDGSIAGSHATAHGDVEFESDPNSKSACWLQSEISPNFPARSPVTTSGSVTRPVFGLGGMVRRR